jgi:YidC/Oxa1 family membrane protein insertase
MDKRLIAFVFLSSAIMLGYMQLLSWQQGPPPAQLQVGAEADPAEADAEANAADNAGAVEENSDVAAAADQPDDADQPAADKPETGAEQPHADEVVPGAGDQPAVAVDDSLQPPQAWVSVGSLDEASGERMLVVLNNRGAAVDSVELTGRRYRDLDASTGYLGRLAVTTPADQKGALVAVVGDGTPAAAAGLKPGDLVKWVGDEEIADAESFRIAVGENRPGTTVHLTVQRDGESVDLTATLTRIPLPLIEPEGEDPASLLLGLSKTEGGASAELIAQAENRLRYGTWDFEQLDPRTVVFRCPLPSLGLEVIKRYRLAEPAAADADVDADEDAGAGYSLTLDVEIRNTADVASEVAYRLDGPNGLPAEGWWYAQKISPNWRDAAGMRDVVTGFSLERGGVNHELISNQSIRDDKFERRSDADGDGTLTYIGVDTQYFAAVLIPKKHDPQSEWFATIVPMKVGPVPDENELAKMTNVSFALETQPVELAAGGTLKNTYELFVGPKQPQLLEQYGLSRLAYYGMFGWVSNILLGVLHTFYWVIPNYGLAIVLLTVLVRLCMFPLSRQQVRSAQKMQELQPELKKLQEKYKKDTEKRTRAQQELFRKHNYNPMGGCLVLFVQLPIFMGLYRALAVDVELRQAPLLWDGCPWATNLAAPDMFMRWDAFMPAMVVNFLGPYLNLLPLVTVALFIVQQKMFMPPAADDQAKMQQQIMKYMMVFVGFMFFRVPSGLCVYFIASSLWGIAERKLLPLGSAAKSTPTAPSAERPRPQPKPGGNNSGGNGAPMSGKKKSRRR